MSPNSGETQQYNIEAPKTVESSGTEITGSEQIIKSPENRPQSQSAPVSAQAVADLALPAQSTASSLSDDTQVQTVDQPAAQSDDSDRIEKQWVDKAKTIIAKTREDPYEQKKELSQFKAEYIKKRFNKTIKTDDAVVGG
ncbi:MAG TPA: hypothetical protein VFP35_01270 [Candidatus Saccharimonadales bacterium]|nr:hypothetical protein [Candidatus Saccharimonadales bacterium]